MEANPPLLADASGDAIETNDKKRIRTLKLSLDANEAASDEDKDGAYEFEHSWQSREGSPAGASSLIIIHARRFESLKDNRVKEELFHSLKANKIDYGKRSVFQKQMYLFEGDGDASIRYEWGDLHQEMNKQFEWYVGSAVLNSTALTHLYLSDDLGKQVLEGRLLHTFVEALQTCNRLRTLSINGCIFPTLESWDLFLVSLPGCEHLEHLELSSCGVDDERARLLAGILYRTSITKLTLTRNEFAEVGLSYLLGRRRIPNEPSPVSALETIDFGLEYMTDAIAKELALLFYRGGDSGIALRSVKVTYDMGIFTYRDGFEGYELLLNSLRNNNWLEEFSCTPVNNVAASLPDRLFLELRGIVLENTTLRELILSTFILDSSQDATIEQDRQETNYRIHVVA